MKITPFIIAVGDVPYKKYSLEILKDFFSNLNIEPFILEESGDKNYKKAHPSWLKLISHKYIQDEDSVVLCWDLDLLPVKKSLQFNLSETNFSLAFDTSIVLGKQGFNEKFRFNCGLIGIPPNKRNFCEKIYNNKAPGTYPSYEQYYFNDELVDSNELINLIPVRYNTLFHNGPLMYEAENIHYTWPCINESDRLKLIIKHHEQYFSN
jgi:hypothetical protein